MQSALASDLASNFGTLSQREQRALLVPGGIEESKGSTKTAPKVDTRRKLPRPDSEASFQLPDLGLRVFCS